VCIPTDPGVLLTRFAVWLSIQVPQSGPSTVLIYVCGRYVHLTFLKEFSFMCDGCQKCANLD
jgi:hypothetical protein